MPKGAWIHVKRIKDKELRAAAAAQDEKAGKRGTTHVCILCWSSPVAFFTPDDANNDPIMARAKHYPARKSAAWAKQPQPPFAGQL